MKSIAENLPELKDLNLRYCYKISDASVHAICENLPLLSKLNLSQCSRITDAAIWNLANSLLCIKELRLWGCMKLTCTSVLAITTKLPTLNLVDIRSRDKFEAVIGGKSAMEYFVETYRTTLRKWEQSEQVGVFKRLKKDVQVQGECNESLSTYRASLVVQRA